jgi:hypothetical protein
MTDFALNDNGANYCEYNSIDIIQKGIAGD